MAPPPTTIVPLSVVIAEGRILLAAKRGAAEVIVNRKIAPTIKREVSVAIDGNIVSRAKIPIAREVLLAKRAHPGVLIDHPVWVCARRHISPLPNWRGRSITVRARHCAGVCRPCRPNIRCSLRLRSIRPSVVVWLTPRCERQREASDAY